MSTTLLYAAVAIVVSAIVLGPLALRDPKRLRAGAVQSLSPLPRGQRRVLGCVVLLPGVVLIAAGEWPAFLIWFGAAAVLGWAYAQILAPRTHRDHR